LKLRGEQIDVEGRANKGEVGEKGNFKVQLRLSF